MIVTARQMYEAVLSELRKENTTSMTPVEFNYHVGAAMLQWLQTRYFAFEEHQKHIDDLEQIVVRTTGQNGMPSPLLNIGEAKTGKEVFQIQGSAAIGGNGKVFLLNVQFQTTNDPCGNSLRTARLKKIDSIGSDNAYDQPTDSNLYYYQMHGKIWRYDTGRSKSIAAQAIVSYLRYPKAIIVDEITGESISNSEFDERINLEIVKWTALSFLETIESTRQRSMQAEQAGVFNEMSPLQKR